MLPAVCAAGAVLVCALLATLLWVRRHKRRSKQQQQLLPQAADGAKPLSSFEGKDAQDGDSDCSNDPQKARKRTDRFVLLGLGDRFLNMLCRGYGVSTERTRQL
jgi:hypothetical protein